MSGAAQRDHGPAPALLVARGLGAWLCAVVVFAVVALMLVTIAGQGFANISRVQMPGSEAGIGDLLFWSAIVVGTALPPSALIAFFAAVAASERPLGRAAGAVVNASLRFAPAIPGVVIGVAVLAVLTSDSAILAWARSNAWTAAAVALGALNLPIMTARFRTVFRTVPPRWRSAAASAGADPAETFFGVVAPRAVPGIIAVLLNAAGQMLGETVLVAIVLSVENGSRQANGVTAFAPVPLAVHLWQDLTVGHPDLSNASVAASETLLLLAAIVALRFAARMLLRRRRRLAASA